MLRLKNHSAGFSSWCWESPAGWNVSESVPLRFWPSLSRSFDCIQICLLFLIICHTHLPFYIWPKKNCSIPFVIKHLFHLCSSFIVYIHACFLGDFPAWAVYAEMLRGWSSNFAQKFTPSWTGQRSKVIGASKAVRGHSHLQRTQKRLTLMLNSYVQ